MAGCLHGFLQIAINKHPSKHPSISIWRFGHLGSFWLSAARDPKAPDGMGVPISLQGFGPGCLLGFLLIENEDNI